MRGENAPRGWGSIDAGSETCFGGSRPSGAAGARLQLRIGVDVAELGCCALGAKFGLQGPFPAHRSPTPPLMNISNRTHRFAFPQIVGLCLVAPMRTNASLPPTFRATPYVTAERTELRISEQPPLTFAPKPQVGELEPAVFVDPEKTFQSVAGIGGALTDASAEVFDQLPPAAQERFMMAYFDPKDGIGYSLARTSIASCDFSSGTYAYVMENDAALKSFDVSHDRAHRIPFIKRAFATAHGQMILFASPWSPPAWMKDNGSVLHGGKLRPEFRQTWANHYVAFIRAYKAEGIDVWGLTVQNEPLAKQIWESCIFTAEEERDFIRDYLGPTLQKAGMGDVKLIAWDHNRDLIYHRASIVLDDPEAAKFVWGIGYHWYESWTKTGTLFENIRRVHEAYPKANLIFTEGCNGNFEHSRLGDWGLGERYGLAMINDFNSGAVGWTDWNVLLDQTGGPNHVGNYCFAPVHAELPEGRLVFTSSYYYIGHFSKFVRPGAVRIAVTATRGNLLATGFKNTDGSVAVIVMNTGDNATDYFFWTAGKAASVHSLPHSITTIILGPPQGA